MRQRCSSTSIRRVVLASGEELELCDDRAKGVASIELVVLWWWMSFWPRRSRGLSLHRSKSAPSRARDTSTQPDAKRGTSMVLDLPPWCIIPRRWDPRPVEY